MKILLEPYESGSFSGRIGIQLLNLGRHRDLAATSTIAIQRQSGHLPPFGGRGIDGLRYHRQASRPRARDEVGGVIDMRCSNSMVGEFAIAVTSVKHLKEKLSVWAGHS